MSFFLLGGDKPLIPRGDYTVVRAAEVISQEAHPKNPGEGYRWNPCESADVEKFTPLFVENGVRYYGYL